MLLIIHNLPDNVSYYDIKSLIISKCGLSDLILDNLVPEGNGKRVTVGVAEESDAAILVRKINGIYWSGHQLFVEDARQKASDQPYHAQSSYQIQRQQSPSYQENAISHTMQTPTVPNMMNMGMNQMYYMPVQNTPYFGYGGQSQQMTNQSIPKYQQSAGQIEQPNTFEGEGNNANFQGRWPSMPGYNDEPLIPPQEEPNAQSRTRSPIGYNRPDREFSARDHQRRDSGRNEPPRYSPKSRSPPRMRDHFSEIRHRDSSAGSRNDRGQQRPLSDRSEGFPPENFGRNSKSDNTRGRGSHSQAPSRGKYPRWEDTEAYQSRGNRQERPERMPPRKQQDVNNRPGDNRRKRDIQEPPPNRARYQHSDHGEPPTKRFAVSRFEKPTDRNKPNKKFENDLKIQNRTDTYRGQAGAIILKEMLSNPKMQIEREMIPLLRTAIRQHIDRIMEGTSDVQPADVVKLYRCSFPRRADRGFLHKVKRANSEASRVPLKGENPLVHHRDGEPTVAGSKVVPEAPEVEKPQPFVSAPEEQPPRRKIPTYIEGSKKKHQEIKKQNKVETTDPNSYKLDPTLDKVLNEEIDVMVNMFVEEFANPETEMDHKLKKHLTKEVIEELKWVFKLPTSKRLLNIKNNHLIRIFGNPKLPKRAPLEAFLHNFGVMSLKKSDRKPLYIATCDSYENYDRLCSLAEAVIDNFPCSFKPMYVAGIPNKKKGMHRFKFGEPNRNIQAFDAVPSTSPGIKIENDDAYNNSAKNIKNEDSKNDNIVADDNIAANNVANIDSIKSDIISCANIDSVKTDNVSGEGSGLGNNHIETDNDNAGTGDSSFIADVNALIAHIDDDEEDDQDGDHVNFDLDELADVDLKEEDLEDY